jgi:uncharacterized protein (TIGR02271 family)
MTQTANHVETLIGQSLVDRNGDKVGKIEDVYLDQDTRQPEWILVNSGLFGTKQSFVPFANAVRSGDGLKAAYDKETIKDAPRADPDGELSQEEEATLYNHYDLDYSESSSDTGLPTGERAQTPWADGTPDSGRGGTVANDTSGRETDSAMTRSEEELRVDKVRRPSEMVRLRKSIVEQDVSMTVPVEREVLRVEREPITDANRDAAMRGGDMTTEEVELELSAEEVTVGKKVVPKERIRLDKDVVVDEEQVSETVRKEEVDIDEAGYGRT